MKKIVVLCLFTLQLSLQAHLLELPVEKIAAPNETTTAALPTLSDDTWAEIVQHYFYLFDYENFPLVMEGAHKLITSFSNKKMTALVINELYKLYKSEDQECTRLIFAAELSSLPIVVNWMHQYKNIQHEIDTERLDTTPLISAAGSGSIAAVKFLLSRMANIHQSASKDGWNALMVTAFRNKVPVLSFLLSEKANIDSVDAAKRTPLNIAVEEGSLEICKYLLNKHADTEIGADSDCGSPLLTAINLCDAQSVKLLLHYGANPNVILQKRIPALNLALTNLNPEIVARLAKNSHRPEHEIRAEAQQIVESLINSPAIDLHAKGIYGTNPLQLAQQFGLTDIEKKIRNSTTATPSSSANRPQKKIINPNLHR